MKRREIDMASKERFCWYCGESLGVIEDKFYDRDDVCGAVECHRALRDVYREEHADLDRGWIGNERRYK